VLCLVTAAVAVSAFDYGVRRDQRIQEVAEVTHREIIQHTAPSPHRYRVLVPFALQPAIAAAEHVMAPSLAFRRVYDVYYLIAFALMLVTLRQYLRSWYSDDQSLIGALFVASTLPIVLRQHYFEPASFLEPSLITIALLWTYRGLAWRVVPLTIIASFTRETAVFIPVACWFAASASAVKYPRGTMTAVTFSSLMLSAVIFAGLRWRLGVAPHVSLADVWTINTGGEGLLAAFVNVSLFLGGAGWILVVAGYRRAPVFVQQALRFTPIYVATLAVWAVWYEVRLLMLLYPVLVPCMLSAIVSGERVVAGDAGR
jgi:hypothetical protein